MKDITILDQGIDMIFGGFNPTQYAEKYIFRNGERVEHYEIECPREMWQDIAENFGKEVIVLKRDSAGLRIRISTVPSKMRKWVFVNLTKCNVIGPKHMRDEVQRYADEVYRKFWK